MDGLLTQHPDNIWPYCICMEGDATYQKEEGSRSQGRGVQSSSSSIRIALTGNRGIIKT